MDASMLKMALKSLPPLPRRQDRWTKNQRAIRRHAEIDALDHFLEWSTIQATMYVGAGPYYTLERDVVKQHWPDRWVKACRYDSYGHPSEARLIDPNLVHQAYHIARWETEITHSIHTMKRIMEFGGGYGALPLVLLRGGWRGDYTVYDLPELILIQRHYLAQFEEIGSHIWGSDTSWWGDHWRCDLCIALWSLSEVPKPAMKRAFQAINADHVLIALADTSPLVRLIEQDQRWQWQQSAILHIPGCSYWYGEPR